MDMKELIENKKRWFRKPAGHPQSVFAELAKYCESIGEKEFRGTQIF